MAERVREFQEFSFIRTLIPCIRAPLSWHHLDLPKVPALNVITVGLRHPPVNFGVSQAFTPQQLKGRECQLTEGLEHHAMETEF